MGLPYPGGPQIDKMAKLGDPKKYDFPRSMIGSKDYDFSFSGLKTSVRYFLSREFMYEVPEADIPNVCASLQEAIVDVLVKKSIRAALDYKAKEIYISGGVSANSRLRGKMEEQAEKKGLKSFAPEISLCIDNAGMIGFIAEKKLADSENIEEFSNLRFTVSPSAIRAKKSITKIKKSDDLSVVGFFFDLILIKMITNRKGYGHNIRVFCNCLSFGIP